MKVHLPIFFCCVFVSIFFFNTLVSLPFPPPHQIEILLAFKNEFPSPTCNHTVLRSWTRNTGSFDGAVFDNETGVVTELHLENACLRGTIKKNSNLFKFPHLRYLDLSYNNFDSSSFPDEFGRLANLEVLNFRYSRMVGKVPSSIHNLSRLTFLDLSHNDLQGGFPLVYNITTLSFLSLSYNNFYGSIPSSLLTMPFLSHLHLRENRLRDPLENLNSSSTSKLESLSLGRNFFTGRILEPISKLVKLTYLDLSFLNIIYPINIVFLPLKSLEYLDLSGNSLGNSLSRLNTSSDHALPKLFELNLSSCNIVEFPKFLATLQSLKYLDLSWNSLSRQLNTSSDYTLTKVIKFDLSNCNMVKFPKFLMNFKSLEYLDLSNNRLKGKVPGWLWNLPLTKLSLFGNSFDGFEGSPNVLLNSSVEMLDLSSNAFGGPLPILPPTMDSMVASNNSFTGDLSLSLCIPRKLRLLDLSYNNFSGPIPQCLGDSGTVILRRNKLTGKLPDKFCRSGSLTTLDVSYNQITGELPRSLANCTSLLFLHVGSNRITDTFPFWLNDLPKLKVIVLRSNRFYGSIYSPQHPLSFPELGIIDISLNHFNGSLPPNYFVNWCTSLISISEDGPVYMADNYLHEYSLSMYSRGLNLEFEKILVAYRAIDFSGNKLQGQIPESIGLLKSLNVLNLTNNDFNGHIPSSLAKLTDLESLDLSRNQLSGEIPQELGSLSFLSYINMSHNKLTGLIPQVTQFQSQPESAFEGNIDLCCFSEQENGSSENGTPWKQEHALNSKAPTIGCYYRPTLMMFGLGIGQVMWFINLFHF